MFTKHKFSKKTKVTALCLLVVIGVFLALELTGRTSFIFDRDAKSDNQAKTTSDAPSAQSDYSSGDNRQPATPRPNTDEISVSDTGGSTASGVAALRSADGVISVDNPAKNALFTSGSSLSGTSNVPKVSYRLMDDMSGVTATGDLAVANGKFSGKFTFSTKASVGRLDVFQVGSGGIEKSIIEIPVRFK